MKKIILHLSSRYSSFGTFNASKRYFKIFEKENFQNYYLTGRIDTSDFDKKKSKIRLFNSDNNIFFYKINYFIEKFINYILQKKKSEMYWSHSLINISILDKINKLKKADIIFLYWINDNFLTLENIKKIFSLNKPILWRFSDMWPMTGGCHYSYDCKKYINNCNNCPQLVKKNYFDLANIVFEQKKKWNLDNLTILVPSSFMEKKVKESKLFSKVKCVKILNSVDTEFFNFKKKKIKKKITVLVGPFSKSDYERKGLYNLNRVLEKLNKLDKKDFKFILFGGVDPSKIKFTNFDYKNCNFVKSRSEIKKIYQKSDIYLFLSNQDNSPNTVAESLSCGTPIITFKNNGTEDFCINGINSLVIDKFNSSKITDNLNRVYSDRKLLKKLSLNARNFALDNLNQKLINKKIIKLTNQKLNDFKNKKF